MIIKVTFEYFLAAIQWARMLFEFALLLMTNGLLIHQPKLLKLTNFVWIEIVEGTILFIKEMNRLNLVFFRKRTGVKRAEKSSLLKFIFDIAMEIRVLRIFTFERTFIFALALSLPFSDAALTEGGLAFGALNRIQKDFETDFAHKIIILILSLPGQQLKSLNPIFQRFLKLQIFFS